MLWLLTFPCGSPGDPTCEMLLLENTGVFKVWNLQRHRTLEVGSSITILMCPVMLCVISRIWKMNWKLLRDSWTQNKRYCALGSLAVIVSLVSFVFRDVSWGNIPQLFLEGPGTLSELQTFWGDSFSLFHLTTLDKSNLQGLWRWIFFVYTVNAGTDLVSARLPVPWHAPAFQESEHLAGGPFEFSSHPLSSVSLFSLAEPLRFFAIQI